MGIKTLAEAIILQSIEDLWDVRHRSESLEFFSGQNFRDCAKLAGINIDNKLRLLKLIKKIAGHPQEQTKIRNTVGRSNKVHHAMTF